MINKSRTLDNIFIFTPDDVYDFDKSLERLANYARIGVMDAGAKLEMIFLRDQPTLDLTSRQDILYSSADTLIADRVSQQILERFRQIAKPDTCN